MLTALGRHPNRPAHIHFIVTAPGYDPIITHIFTPDSEYLSEDAVFGVKETLIADLDKVDDPAEGNRLGIATPFWLISWNFTLAAKAQPDYP